MAEFTCSVWKITHGSTVLLNFGDRLRAEPSSDFSKQIEVVPFLRSENVGVFDRKNIQRNMSWQIVKRFADVKSSREWRLEHDIEVSELGVDDMTIEIDDGDTWILRNASVQAMTTVSGREVSTNAFEAMADYNVVGGKLEIVTP